MADSFFGFDSSFPNQNDDEGGGEPSEDEYDALNDETFGQDSDELDWEVEHEQLAEQLESSRRHNSDLDDVNSQLEASLSKLVLDEPDSPQPRHTIGSSVWRHDVPFPTAPTPVPPLKNVCTVEELERQLRQSQAPQQQGAFPGQNFYQHRFPPVILQRPPGLQAPVPLPYAPQPPIGHNGNQMNQSLNKVIGQPGQIKQLMQNQMIQNINPMGGPSMNQMVPNMNQINQSMNQMGQNMNQIGQNMSQMGQNMSQMGQNMNQIGPIANQMGQNLNKISQNVNQMAQNNPFMQNNHMNAQFQSNQMGQSMLNPMPHNMQNVHQMSQTNQLLPNSMGQNINQMDQSIGKNMNQVGQNINHMGQNLKQIGQNMNHMGQGLNPLGQNLNQMGQNQMMSNGCQFGSGMNQYPHMMGQSRMLPAPPGIGMPRQNFPPSLNQFNSNFRGPMPTNKGTEQQPPLNRNMMMNQHLKNQTPQINQIPIKPIMNSPQMSSQQLSSQHLSTQQMNTQHMGSQQMTNHHMSSQQMGLQQNASQQINPQQINTKQMNMHHSNTQQINSQQTNTHQMNSQQISTQQMNSQQTNIQQMNSQQTNTQPMNSQQTNTQQMNSQQTNTQQMNSQQTNTQQMNSQIMNAPQNRSSQSANIKVANQKNEKVQKSPFYNNTNTNTNKVMPPQSLAKFLIQNTYPVVPYNNSLHNANHHPMLNSRSAVFTNSQFMNSHPMFNNQRPSNGMYSTITRHLMNGDTEIVDLYAGMMTPRDKQFLFNIQNVQLETGTPYIHDFYYTVFVERMMNKDKEGVKEAHKANQQNHPFYSGAVKHEQQPRERHNSHRHNSTGDDGAAPRVYVPTQFENSLGKLQCGSVTAPRKIIDVDFMTLESSSTRVSRAPSVASTTNPSEVPRESRRTKQLLLDIEALYLILLRLEELNDPLAISNALILKERAEKQKQAETTQKEALENELEEDSNLFLRNIESVQRRSKQDLPKTESVDKRQVVKIATTQKPVPMKNLLDEDKDELLNKLFAGLLQNDRLPQVLTVRKGRALVRRFVCRAPVTHVRLRALWSRVLRALSHAARRDDGGLATLAPHFRRYLQNTTGWSAVLESCAILTEALDPARTPHALTTALTLSCVCAMLEKAMILVNTPEATSSERQWFKFLKTLARALKNTTLAVAKPVRPLPEIKVLHHLRQLDSRSTVEILQRGRTTAEFADLTKNDVTEQLTKHLC